MTPTPEPSLFSPVSPLPSSMKEAGMLSPLSSSNARPIRVMSSLLVSCLMAVMAVIVVVVG